MGKSKKSEKVRNWKKFEIRISRETEKQEIRK